MAIAPNNPPNQVTNSDAAIPTALVVDGAFVSSLNPIPTTTGGASTFPITTLYIVTTGFVDANGTCALNDILQNIVVYNSSGTIIVEVWNNTTAGFTLAAPPPSADIAVYVAGGAATAANQVLEIAELTTISGQLPTLLGQQLPADSLSVVLSNPTSSDISATGLYTANAAGTGYSIGDVVQGIAVYTPGTPNVLVSTTWNNLTTGLTIASAPPAADLTPVTGGGGSTNVDTSTTALYYVVSANTGYSVNDVIQEVVILDPSTVPPTVVSTEYNNLTQGTRNITIAVQTDIVPIGTPGTASVSDLTFASNYTGIVTVAGQFNQGDVLARYVVLDPSTTVPTVVSETWYNLNQQTTLTITPSTVQVVPVVGSDLNTTATYYATIANPGNYAIGDVIQQNVIVNPVAVPPAVLSTTYNNLTTGAQNISVILTDLVPTDAPGANVSSDAPVVSLYAANTANVGIGYSIGDTIQKIEIINPAGATVVSTTWVNLTTGSTITAPVISELTASQSQLPPALGIQTAGKSLSVYVSNPTANTSFPVTSQYTVSTAFASPAPGGAIGDLVQELQVYDTSVSPAVITTTVWSNLTTNVVYPTPVNFADLTPVTSTALTNAELRASPVPVFSNTETTFLYTVTTAFTGALVGEILARVITFQATSTVPTQLDETWYNISAGTILGSAPSYTNISASSSSTVTPSLPAVTASVTVETGAGTTPAGATSVSFANNGAANATVAGAILPPTASLDFTANAGSSINAISFDGTGTSLLVAVLA